MGKATGWEDLESVDSTGNNSISVPKVTGWEDLENQTEKPLPSSEVNNFPTGPNIDPKYLSFKGLAWGADKTLSNPVVSHILDPFQGVPGKALFGGDTTKVNSYSMVPNMGGVVPMFPPSVYENQPQVSAGKYSEDVVNMATNPWNYVGEGAAVLGKAPFVLGKKTIHKLSGFNLEGMGKDIRNMVLDPEKMGKEFVARNEARNLSPEEVSTIENSKVFSPEDIEVIRKNAHASTKSSLSEQVKSLIDPNYKYDPSEIDDFIHKNYSKINSAKKEALKKALSNKKLTDSQRNSIIKNNGIVPDYLKQDDSKEIIENAKKGAAQFLKNIEDKKGTAKSLSFGNLNDVSIFYLLSHLHPGVAGAVVGGKNIHKVFKALKDPLVSIKYYNMLDNSEKAEFAKWAAKAIKTASTTGMPAAASQTLYNGSAKPDTSKYSNDSSNVEEDIPIDLGDY